MIHKTNRHDRRGGFTLVELLAVLGLMAMLGAAAVAMVHLPLSKAHCACSIAKIHVIDSIARERARKAGELSLVFDSKRSLLSLVDQSGQTVIAPVTLSGKQRFLGFVGADNNHAGLHLVDYDQLGTSKTFAVEIGESKKQSAWLLILGMTGQAYELKEREDVHAIISSMRNDAY